jgi:hypothetical protein
MAAFASVMWAEDHAAENSIVVWASAHLNMSLYHDATDAVADLGETPIRLIPGG